MERTADWALALEGRVKVKQGRVGEGEADVRRALLSRLSKSGNFTPIRPACLACWFT